MADEPHGLARGLTNYGDLDFSRFLRRSFARSMGYSVESLEKPIVGIVMTPSGFNNCHRGMPELVDMRAVYRADPPSMAAYGARLHAAGARIVGACCGSSPDHLRAMHAALVPAAS